MKKRTHRPEMRPEWPQSARAAFFVSLALFVTFIVICAAFLAWKRRASAGF
ncbi:hypothetical protein [Bradyrhizobium sp. DOA1]|uniref:hypothetical protein n=1 Tax=Bradyrhizobium sp. DOA1 TaxID=1126616 RepID=UPI000B0034D5|nr:hypothetical protein [Bradyrhizobium sp. DOA1]